jgi:hypothetical protein
MRGIEVAGRGLAWAWKKLFGRAAQALPLPTKTIVAMPQPRINAMWWHDAKWGDKPRVQVVGDFDVTNIWTQDVRVPSAVIKYRRSFWSHTKHVGSCMVKDLRSPYSGNYPIPPGQMSMARVMFDVPVRKKREPGHFKADVALIDQLGNRHWVRGIEFTDHRRLLE